jgi:nucleoside-diphosphate-sugar epimerase
MRIFVSGASGLVGKSLIRLLISENHEVLGLVRNDQDAKALKTLKVTPIKGDLRTIKEYNEILKEVDVVVHSGAMVRFVGKFDEFFQINVNGTKKLLDSSIRAGVKKFIYISAAAVALDGNPLHNIKEDYRPQNRIKSNYLLSKVLAEKELLERKDKIQVIILRPPVIWGPGMRIMEEFRSTIEKIGFPTIGDPDHHLATCHVDNLNTAIIRSVNNENARGIYHVSDQEKVKVRTFMRDLIKGYGMKMGNMRMPKSMAMIMAQMMEFIWKIFNLKGNPPISTLIVHLMGTEFTINDEKAREELGYQDVITVSEGLGRLQRN